jgi:pilus assembly protein Flp/PilA
MLRAFLRDERGATAIEYGLIASVIFLAIITSVTLYGDKTTALYDRISGAVAAAIKD